MTVVLLHALALGSDMWAGPRRALERAGHRVLSPNQRGYGTTPLGTAPPALDVAADDLAAFLDGQGIGDVHLVGCSMGGYLAMAFLRRHPGRVRALALLATRADADDAPTAAHRVALADLILDPVHRPRLIESTVPLLVGATTRAARPEVVRRVTELVEATGPEAIAWSHRAIAARADSFAVLRAFDRPSLVLAGAEDGLVTAEEYHRLLDALPRGELVTVPEAGHLTPLEAPDAVAAALLSWVGAGSGRR